MEHNTSDDAFAFLYILLLSETALQVYYSDPFTLLSLHLCGSEQWPVITVQQIWYGDHVDCSDRDREGKFCEDGNGDEIMDTGWDGENPWGWGGMGKIMDEMCMGTVC